MTHNTTFNLARMLEKEQLSAFSSNFMVQFRNLKIVLKSVNKEYVLQKALVDTPGDNATENERNIYQSKSDDYVVVQCTIFASMKQKLQ